MAEQLSPVLLSKSERLRRESGERSSSVSVSRVGLQCWVEWGFSYLTGAIPESQLFTFDCTIGMPCRAWWGLVILRGRYLPPLLNFVSILVCLLPRSSFSLKKKRQKVIQGDTPWKTPTGSKQSCGVASFGTTHSHNPATLTLRCAILKYVPGLLLC